MCSEEGSLAPNSATRNLTLSEVESFLGNGFFMGLEPDTCWVAWGKPKKLKKPLPDSLQFYVPDFYLSSPAPWLAFENVALADRESLIKNLAELSQQPHLDIQWQEPQREEFEKKFHRVQEAIRKGEISKAVPVVFARARSSVTKSMRALYVRHLLERAKEPQPYGYMTPTEGILGASPEVLFSFDSQTNELETMALAGTRATEEAARRPLLSDRKEMFEHELVVQGIKSKLSGWGDIQVSKTTVWDLGPISHLRTDIGLKIKNPMGAPEFFSESVSRLHPTPALGLSPSEANWLWLKELDGEADRQRFGAPFGFFNPNGRSHVIVAIRNIQWNEEGIFLGSGCGVVEQSELQYEWRELDLKRCYVRGLLGL